MTTYKQIYKALDKNGLIDALINRFATETNIQIVKSDMIFAIELAADFFNSNTFNRMEYWCERPQGLKYILAHYVERYYSIIQINELKSNIEKYEYCVNAQNAIKGFTL